MPRKGHCLSLSSLYLFVIAVPVPEPPVVIPRGAACRLGCSLLGHPPSDAISTVHHATGMVSYCCTEEHDQPTRHPKLPALLSFRGMLLSWAETIRLPNNPTTCTAGRRTAVVKKKTVGYVGLSFREEEALACHQDLTVSRLLIHYHARRHCLATRAPASPPAGGRCPDEHTRARPVFGSIAQLLPSSHLRQGTWASGCAPSSPYAHRASCTTTSPRMMSVKEAEAFATTDAAFSNDAMQHIPGRLVGVSATNPTPGVHLVPGGTGNEPPPERRGEDLLEAYASGTRISSSRRAGRACGALQQQQAVCCDISPPTFLTRHTGKYSEQDLPGSSRGEAQRSALLRLVVCHLPTTSSGGNEHFCCGQPHWVTSASEHAHEPVRALFPVKPPSSQVSFPVVIPFLTLKTRPRNIQTPTKNLFISLDKQSFTVFKCGVLKIAISLMKCTMTAWE